MISTDMSMDWGNDGLLAESSLLWQSTDKLSAKDSDPAGEKNSLSMFSSCTITLDANRATKTLRRLTNKSRSCPHDASKTYSFPSCVWMRQLRSSRANGYKFRSKLAGVTTPTIVNSWIWCGVREIKLVPDRNACLQTNLGKTTRLSSWDPDSNQPVMDFGAECECVFDLEKPSSWLMGAWCQTKLTLCSVATWSIQAMTYGS